MKKKKRKQADKVAKRKSKNEKQKRKLIPKVWVGGIPHTLETLRAKGQRGVLTKDDFFFQHDQ